MLRRVCSSINLNTHTKNLVTAANSAKTLQFRLIRSREHSIRRFSTSINNNMDLCLHENDNSSTYHNESNYSTTSQSGGGRRRPLRRGQASVDPSAAPSSASSLSFEEMNKRFENESVVAQHFGFDDGGEGFNDHQRKNQKGGRAVSGKGHATLTSASIGSVSVLESLPVHEALQKSLARHFKHITELSPVQQKVFDLSFDSERPFTSDVVAQAHTGSGKTLAYLIPIVNDILTNSARTTGIDAVILVPSRELAMQVGAVVEDLLSFAAVESLTLCGGHPRKHDQTQLRTKKPKIIVATPGRLIDHLEGTFMFHELVSKLRFLVMDEADKLLEKGSSKELRSVLGYLPHDRRTFLFSATVTDKVRDVAAKACRSDFAMIDCIDKNTQKQTALTIKEQMCVVPATQTTLALYNALLEEMENNFNNYKIIVFFTSARLTQFYALLFREQFKMPILEIHARKEQHARNIASQRFQNDRTAILFSSDVTSRGMDYPDVSLVLQLGMPASPEQYVHRVGRTGRAGKDGRALLLLSEHEAPSVPRFFRNIGVSHSTKAKKRSFNNLMNQNSASKDNEEPMEDPEVLKSIQSVSAENFLAPRPLVALATSSWRSNAQLIHAAQAAYASMLTHYRLRCPFAMDPTETIAHAQGLVLSAGLPDTPTVSKELASETGLEGHPLLRVQEGQDVLQDIEAAIQAKKRGAMQVADPRKIRQERVEQLTKHQR